MFVSARRDCKRSQLKLALSLENAEVSAFICRLQQRVKYYQENPGDGSLEKIEKLRETIFLLCEIYGVDDTGDLSGSR